MIIPLTHSVTKFSITSSSKLGAFHQLNLSLDAPRFSLEFTLLNVVEEKGIRSV